MATTQILRSPAAHSPGPTAERARPRLARVPAALLGLAGSGLVVVGVVLPWLSTFQGLIHQSGWGTQNGTVLFFAAVVAAVLAVGQVVGATTVLRWLLALIGFGIAGFGGYLLIQLYSVSAQLDGMAFGSRGPGLFVVAAGGVLVFATVFLRMPAAHPEASVTASPNAVAGARSNRFTLLAAMVAPLGSPLRYPAAVLALTAGLAHVPVTPTHLQEAPYIGVLFILLTVACVLLAALLLIADSVAVWATVGGICLLAVAAYIISRTIGLPLMADDIGNWLDPLGVVSVLTESSVGALAGCAIWRRTHGGITR